MSILIPNFMPQFHEFDSYVWLSLTKKEWVHSRYIYI